MVRAMTATLSLIAGNVDVACTILVAEGITIFYRPLDAMARRALFEWRVKRQGVSFDCDAKSSFQFRKGE